VIRFMRKLKAHARTEEDLTYPIVLMTGRLRENDQFGVEGGDQLGLDRNCQG